MLIFRIFVSPNVALGAIKYPFYFFLSMYHPYWLNKIDNQSNLRSLSKLIVYTYIKVDILLRVLWDKLKLDNIPYFGQSIDKQNTCM